MATRDRNSDTGRLGEAASSTRANSEVYVQDFSPSTLADEQADGGYRRTDRPVSTRDG